MTQTSGPAPTESASGAFAASAADGPIGKVIVAIHGIGSQSRNATVRSVASRFGGRCKTPLPLMPLGYFNVGDTAEVRISRLQTLQDDDSLRNVGFAEVFWADIPESVVKQNDLLEETKAWGCTVISRAEAIYRYYLPQGGRLQRADFELGIGVVEEIVETIAVLEGLLFMAKKAGLFQFQLGPLLRDYVGDVQLVADFPFQRSRIAYRFHSTMSKIVDAFAAINQKNNATATPEIYIVAHSEGTVVSFLGMLQALQGDVVSDPENKQPDIDGRKWISDVRGYMTIGSPIDKHILLWPGMWDRFNFESRVDADGKVVFQNAAGSPITLKQKIKWRNYYDYGDPIGFQLDTAVELLTERGCLAFEFDTQKHDFGFSRYLLPGKAHNDYWTDDKVFGHFIEDVVLAAGTAERPVNKPLAGLLSTAMPYVLSYLLHLGAVFALFKGLSAWDDLTDSKQIYVGLPTQIALLSGLLMSVTVAARIPRLVKASGARWELLALLAFVAGAIPCAWALPNGLAKSLGEPFTFIVSWLPIQPESLGKAALVAIAFLVAVTGWLVPRKPNYGRRILMVIGTLAVAAIVVNRLSASSMAPTWPVLLAGVAFLYLWWLGILVFDLTFIWHRYIRESVAIDALRQWRRSKDAEPRPLTKLGTRSPAPKTQAP